MLGCCGTPRGGVNPNDKTVMINPPGAYHNRGVNENLTLEIDVINLFRFALCVRNQLDLYCDELHPKKTDVFLSDWYTFLSDSHIFWSYSQECPTRYRDAMQN